MLKIAKIVKPQGIKGECKAQMLTNVLAVFKSLRSARVGGKEMAVERASVRQGFLYIKFAGVDTRNDAEAFRGAFIEVEKDEVEKHTQEFLVDDLIGMTLYDESGDYVGQIMDVEDYGAGDILIIEKDGHTIEAPYVEKAFFRQGDKLVVNRAGFDEVAIW